MKILKDLHKKGSVEFCIDSLDDLWILSKVICVGDRLSGNTQRKLKLGLEGDRNQKIVKKWMYLTVTVEKVEYEPHLKTLRVNGPILEGNEDVAKGDYHSFSLEIESVATLHKNIWHGFEYQRLLQSQKSLLIVLCDKDSAIIGRMTASGYEKTAQLYSHGVKKGDVGVQVASSENFFAQIAKHVMAAQVDRRIIGCSHFWQSELKKYLAVPVFFIDVPDATESALSELLRSDVFKAAITDNIVAEQVRVFEQVLGQLSTTSKATYGLEHVRSAATSGAVSEVLISNSYLTKLRLDGQFDSLEEVLILVEESGGVVHIVDEENPIHKNLLGLSGVVALLRYAVD
jgi:mRNA surveillance protein pelota